MIWNQDVLSIIAEHLTPNPLLFCRLASVNKDFYAVFTSDRVWRKLNVYGLESGIYRHFQDVSANAKGITMAAWQDRRCEETEMLNLSEDLITTDYILLGIRRGRVYYKHISNLNLAICLSYLDDYAFQSVTQEVAMNPKFYTRLLDDIFFRDDITPTLQFLIDISKHDGGQFTTAPEWIKASRYTFIDIEEKMESDHDKQVFYNQLVSGDYFENLRDMLAADMPHVYTKGTFLYCASQSYVLAKSLLLQGDVPESFAKDPEIVKQALKMSFDNFEWADPNLLGDKAFMNDVCESATGTLTDIYDCLPKSIFDPPPTLTEHTALVHRLNEAAVYWYDWDGFRTGTCTPAKVLGYRTMEEAVEAGLDAGVIYTHVPMKYNSDSEAKFDSNDIRIASKLVRGDDLLYSSLHKNLQKDPNLRGVLQDVVKTKAKESGPYKFHYTGEISFVGGDLNLVTEDWHDFLVEYCFPEPHDFYKSPFSNRPDKIKDYFRHNYARSRLVDKHLMWELLPKDLDEKTFEELVCIHGFPLDYDATPRSALLSLQASTDRYIILPNELRNNIDFLCVLVAVNYEFLGKISTDLLTKFPQIQESAWSLSKEEAIERLAKYEEFVAREWV